MLLITRERYMKLNPHYHFHAVFQVITEGKIKEIENKKNYNNKKKAA